MGLISRLALYTKDLAKLLVKRLSSPLNTPLQDTWLPPLLSPFFRLWVSSLRKSTGYRVRRKPSYVISSTSRHRDRAQRTTALCQCCDHSFLALLFPRGFLGGWWNAPHSHARNAQIIVHSHEVHQKILSKHTLWAWSLHFVNSRTFSCC